MNKSDFTGTINVTLGGTVAANTLAKVGDLVGMYMNDGVSGDIVPFLIQGLIKNATKVGSQAWTVGDELYWDNTNTRFTKTPTTGGVVVAIAASVVGSGAGATTGDVYLLGVREQILLGQTAATAKADGAETVTAAQMINGIVVFTVTTGRTLTTPTGVALTAACPSSLRAGDSFRFHLITVGTGADDIATLTAGDGDVTFVGPVTVGPNIQATEGLNAYGTWIFRYAGSNAWVGYRVG